MARQVVIGLIIALVVFIWSTFLARDVYDFKMKKLKERGELRAAEKADFKARMEKAHAFALAAILPIVFLGFVLIIVSGSGK